MDYTLKVFEHNPDGNDSTWNYRFVVVEKNKSKNYPANFVCMLPVKIIGANGRINGLFGTIFGKDSLKFAIDLLNDALRNENDLAIKTEIERRIKLINPSKNAAIICNRCHRNYQAKKIRKYKQNFCNSCLKTK